MVEHVNASGQFGVSQITVSGTLEEARFTTIAEALAEAALTPGSSVYIYPGTYTESLTWPSGVSVVGSTSGESTYEVIIVGNQTFSGGPNASLSIDNILFQSTVGDTWTQDDSLGASLLEFDSCSITSTAGRGVVSSSATALQTKVLFDNCQLVTLLSNVVATGSAAGSVEVESQRSDMLFTSLLTNYNVDLNAFATFKTRNSDYESSAGNCNVHVNDANSSVDSFNNLYDSPTSFVFCYDANGTVKSVQDEIVNATTFWASSSGAYGVLNYGSIVIDTGAAAAIDPQITATNYSTLIPAPSGGVIWSDQGASTTVGSNTGSVSTAAITLTLPAAPSNGDVCEFILSSSANLNVTANAGQTVRLGNSTTAVAGTVSTAVQGNALRLVYNSTLTSWLAASIIGNWVI